MNTGEKRQIKIYFPLSLYLKQVFSNDIYARYINPFDFWRKYRINHLETCHQLDWPVKQSTKIILERNSIDAPTKSLIKQAELNTIYLSQPIIELKYCGVSYFTRDIFSMNTSLVKINSNLFRTNIWKYLENYDKPNNYEKSDSN